MCSHELTFGEANLSSKFWICYNSKRRLESFELPNAEETVCVALLSFGFLDHHGCLFLMFCAVGIVCSMEFAKVSCKSLTAFLMSPTEARLKRLNGYLKR